MLNCREHLWPRGVFVFRISFCIIPGHSGDGPVLAGMDKPGIVLKNKVEGLDRLGEFLACNLLPSPEIVCVDINL